MGDIQIIYEGTDIYPDISVSACIHDMYAGERADELLLRLNDTRELWDIWSPKPGDTIVVRYGAATTGKMYVGSIIPENGLVTLRALSIPQAAKDRTNKTWESIRFLQLCEEIAARHGLTFVHYGITDRVYGYAVQHDLPDFAFLWQRCVLESAAFLVYDGTLVVYSEQYLESQPALGTIVLGPGDDFEYSDDSGSARGRAEVTNGSVTGTYTAPNGSDRTLRKTIPLHMGSRAEADRFAKGLLRNANKDLTTGAIWQPLSPSCAAGSVVSVRTGGTRSWDGRPHTLTARYQMGRRTGRSRALRLGSGAGVARVQRGAPSLQSPQREPEHHKRAYRQVPSYTQYRQTQKLPARQYPHFPHRGDGPLRGRCPPGSVP